MARSTEREHAFIMIFEKTFRPELSVAEIAALAKDAEVFDAEPFAVSLAETVCAHIGDADELIKPRLRNWTIDRLAAETVCVLRLGICEMKYSEGEYAISADYERKIRNKISAFREETQTKFALHLIMVASNELHKNEHSDLVVATLSADDLFH